MHKIELMNKDLQLEEKDLEYRQKLEEKDLEYIQKLLKTKMKKKQALKKSELMKDQALKRCSWNSRKKTVKIRKRELFKSKNMLISFF